MIATFYKVPTDMPLDLVSGAWFAHGLRRLSSSYMGKILRVRRDSDNAEQDIGYTLENALDIMNIRTFIGTANAYVVKLYDQTGNGHDAVQTTVTNQPKLSLVEANGLPALILTKTNVMSLQVTLTGSKPSSFSVLCSYQTSNVNLNSQAACGSAITGANVSMWGLVLQTYFGGNVQNGMIETTIGDSTLTSSIVSNTPQNVMSNSVYETVSVRYQNGNTSPSIHVGGIKQTLTQVGSGSSIGGSTGNYYIGKGYPGTELDGKVLESMVYSNYVSDANMTKIENNIRAYYGI